MNKLLRGILVILLMGSFSMVFAQKIDFGELPCGRIEKCVAGQTWDGTQCKCVTAPCGGTIKLCGEGERWDSTQCKCVTAPCGGTIKLCGIGKRWDSTQCECVAAPCGGMIKLCGEGETWDGTQCKCVSAEPEPTGEMDSFENLPTFENFVLVDSAFYTDEVYLVFSPKWNENVQLYIDLYSENGIDTLWTWCQGDEKTCKAMGNGKDCTDNDTNTWCYGGEL